jgi:glycosyltransferase involved in cell wall biosynthesis
MKISFAILCHDETQPLHEILSLLIVERPYNYEIVIVQDGNHDPTTKLLKDYQDNCNLVSVYKRFLSNDYSAQKNFMTEKCTGDYIFNLDSDELPPEYLLENIHLIIEQNDTECIWVPRVNAVDGLTEQWTMNLGFKIFPDVSKAVAPINEKVMDTESDEYKLLKKLGLIIEESPIK